MLHQSYQQSDIDSAIEALVLYGEDLELCANELMGVTLDTWQSRALKILQRDHFLAIRSGSGVGKSFLMTIAALGFSLTRPFSKVPCTAPAQHQLHDILWSEMFKRINRSPTLANFFDWTQTKIGVRGHEPEWYIVARTSKVRPGGDVAEGLQGFHAEKNLLFLLDEASGIPDEVYPAVEGALTNEGCYCLMAGNPTRKYGFFYDIFHNPKLGKFFSKMHVSCYDSPRVTPRYIEMMEARYGRDHPVFQIKVLGEFPEAETSLLVPPSYVDEMVNNDPISGKGQPVEIGVDIGRVKSPSVLCARRGWEIIKWDEKYKKGTVFDTPMLVRWIIENILELEATTVRIDAIGIGAGVYDVLKETYGDKMIIGVVNSAGCMPEYKERYLNLRAQGFWELREVIPKLYCEQWPERLIYEISDIRTIPTTTGKIKVESKDDMLGRAMRSPDYADAMMNAFLDSQICGDVPIIYTFPHNVIDITDRLKKKGLWHNIGTRWREKRIGSRWAGIRK